MATIFIPPSPQTSLNMSTRRPLANVPNATNSPHRAGLVPAKRARSTQIEIPYGQPPPKKQVMEETDQDARSPRSKSTAYQGAESKLFARRSNNTNPSAFEKKLVAAREKERQPQMKGTRQEKPSAETLDTIRQWQRHYRKAFPQFVFYFDGIQEEVRRKCSRQVIALGAVSVRSCMIFMKSRLFKFGRVGHLSSKPTLIFESSHRSFWSHSTDYFTARGEIFLASSHPRCDCPSYSPQATTSPTEPESAAETANGDVHMQTVDPSLLEKNGESHGVSLKNENRRDQGTMDVLQRARQMSMKIWALEKLQRMIATINDSDIGNQHDTTRNKAVGSTTHGKGETDLSRVLRQELLNGPSDRDPLSSMEMLMFKGPFVYIHDMNEKTKPVMVREYSRVTRRQDGAWPQFRSAPLGKCPFIDEPPSRKEYDRLRMRQLQKEKKAAAATNDDSRSAKQTAAPAVGKVPESKPAPEFLKSKQPDEPEQRVSPPTQPEMAKPSFDETHERKSSESFLAPHFPRTGAFYTGREPAASGVQPSNITSAIRSQMISSTAAAPGAKAGLSKEVHGLKRKVLEKGTAGIVTGSMAAPQRHGDGSALYPSKTQNNHPTKSTVPEKNGLAHDDSTHRSEAAGAKRRRDDGKNNSEQKKPERRRDPKPGYCENCRDKFDDFEDHTLTRKHRRFAANSTNWAELDALLFEIQRPLKEEYELDE
ncbi:hypothetical protein NUU61_003115 [Penicillium alfredii]|uniref:DBF4-type domain-containing protein n=1 Tax=Penicillium alfredii TaxID=1506179 RepID=A0A9W9FSY1_9EURO|nr:uncharacterized protein NUU61_003115 [Penicillium alfredii]KAJ5105768.1 hypothetical protein NUU61_003115 [Penicillium alfredii]